MEERQPPVRSVHHTAEGESMRMFYSTVLCCCPRFLFHDRPRIFSRGLVWASIAAAYMQTHQQCRAARQWWLSPLDFPLSTQGRKSGDTTSGGTRTPDFFRAFIQIKPLSYSVGAARKRGNHVERTTITERSIRESKVE